jgi:hypothetical protein
MTAWVLSLSHNSINILSQVEAMYHQKDKDVNFTKIIKKVGNELKVWMG